MAMTAATWHPMIASWGQIGTLHSRREDADYTVTIVVTEYDDQERDGDVIRDSDHKVFLSAFQLTVEPLADDTLTDKNGKKSRVVVVHPIAPAGTPLAYELQVRD